MRRAGILIFTLAILSAGSAVAPQNQQPQPDASARSRLTPGQQAAERARREVEANAPRPIDALDTVWIEEMTWMEVRDAIKAGKTLAVIGTGGLEQNGPYAPTGKHNYVLRATCEAIARKLGHALVAPIVTLEPGNPDREGLTPGSVFVTQETFKAILTDMATSLKSMGFKEIVMIGDNGGNTNGMRESAAALNAKWRGTPARVHFVPEYYEEDKWSFNYLKTIGIYQQPDVQSATRADIHDDYHYESLIAVIDPRLIRPEQRIKAGKFSINGVEMESIAKVVANGKKLAEHRARITSDAIQKAIATWKEPR